MICLDHGQPDAVEVQGVRVFKSHAPDAGIPGLRFVHPRLTAVWAAARRAGADLYYQRSAGVITGWVSLFCNRRGIPFVFAVASDADLEGRLPLLERRREKAIFRAGLRHASAVVVQSDRQMALCRSLLGREGALVRSCYGPPAGARRDGRGYVLWVSTLRAWKRPDVLLDIAQRLPHIRFRVIGGGDGSKYASGIQARAARMDNVELMGYVPHADIEPHFDGARLVVNTSDVEGFPNTFLQAWARGIPTVSFVRPAEILEQLPIRLAVDDSEEMVRTIEVLMGSDSFWDHAGAQLQAYFRSHHSVGAAVASYTQLFTFLGVPPGLQRCAPP